MTPSPATSTPTPTPTPTSTPRLAGSRDPHEWLRDFPSTQATVFVGLLLAVLYVVSALVAALLDKPFNGETHFALSSFILALCGLNFAVKRLTDRELHEARARGKAPAVNVEQASRVSTEVNQQQ